MPDAAPAKTIGVAGAGTMGVGIAQLACLSGARTLLHDPQPEALASGVERIKRDLRRSVQRGRLSEADADAAGGLLDAVADLDRFGPCQLVIEAAPESLELKRELFKRLVEVVSEDCVLATNTSSLPVTAIAGRL